jgi:hypothetical protein
MATDERARTVLHECLDEAVGPDAADTLMGYLPPVGWADVATRADLVHLETRLEAKMDQRFAEVDGRFSQMDARMAQLETAFERGLRQAVLALVGVMIASVSVAVGAAVGITQLLH